MIENVETLSGGGYSVDSQIIPSNYLYNIDFKDREKINTMYYYAKDHIPNYSSITTYPNDIQYNPNTVGVTNFSYAFHNMKNCTETLESIYNRFDWNSCTNMRSAFGCTYDFPMSKLYGSIPEIPNIVTDMSWAFAYLCNLSGSIPNIPNSVIYMSYAFYNCRNLTGSIPNIPNNVTNMSDAFYRCYNLTGSIPEIPNGVLYINDAFYNCRNLTGSIPEIPNTISNMVYAFYYCYNLTGSIPNIPNSVTNMYRTFYECESLSSSNVYIHSDNVSNAINCFYNMGNTMNIYVHAGTATYNSFYKAMGNSTYNSKWNCYLKTF